MRFTNLITVLGLAAAATASPMPIDEAAISLNTRTGYFPWDTECHCIYPTGGTDTKYTRDCCLHSENEFYDPNSTTCWVMQHQSDEFKKCCIGFDIDAPTSGNCELKH